MERSLAASNEALGETRKQMAREQVATGYKSSYQGLVMSCPLLQEDLRSKEERIQRLERRLLFVTKVT